MPCDPSCSWCHRDAWRWIKAREAAMRRVKPGDGQSFAAAAATSNIPRDQASPMFAVAPF